MFTLETMPPGIQIVELSAPDGFVDPDTAVTALRSLAERMGVSIDWSTAEESEVQGVTVQQYWDPEPGLNASASVGRIGQVIVLLRWSIAP